MYKRQGIDRTVARNQDLETPADVAKVQEHNEREEDSYSNQDIDVYKRQPLSSPSTMSRSVSLAVSRITGI